MSRFRDQHLHDYPPAAALAWAALVLVGLACLVLALASELAHGGPPPLTVLLGLGLVALAAAFPVHIPRTAYAVGVADLFLFTLLAVAGPATAVLAAAIEGAVGAWRASPRLTARLSTPAAAAFSMSVAGLAYATLGPWLETRGFDPGAAGFVALCAVAPLYFVCSTLPLTWVIAIKRGHSLSLSAWWHGSSWVGALYGAAALAAGLAQLHLARLDPVVIGAGAVLCLGVVAVLRQTLGRQERERQAQDLRIADAEREAQLNQQRFRAAFDNAAVGMAIVRADGRLLQVNAALRELLRRDDDTLLGSTFEDHLHPGDAALFKRHATEVLRSREHRFSIELRCLAGGDGPQERWVSLHCGHFDDPGNTGTCLIYQLHDISSRRQAESELFHIAYHDLLTDLPNRQCFQERLAVAVERSRLDPAVRFAVMFLDLDRFKVVNDSLGHVAGNRLLREVAQRLAQSVRPGDLVARLGGDEFAVLLEGLHTPEIGLRLAERLREVLSQPVALHGTEVVPGASIGITFSDMGYRVVDEVLRDADLAMYEAKGAGRGRVVLFDSSMHDRIADRLALEADLRRAIGAGQLSVMFQPLFHLDPYRPYGFEALARWVHPERGPVSPAVFITLAEESGHIAALTQWVVEHAVAQMSQWQRQEPALRGLGMHVNISGRDLADPALVPHVQQVLARHGLAAEQLTLEITETTLMGELDKSMEAMRRLREIGVRFSIDDFGTGYSSLAYLSTLPIDSLKIDRSFVMHLQQQPQNIEIIRAVMTLGRSLGKRIVAEGIETPEQLAALRELGVHVGQGYLLSRPLRADQVPAALAASVTLAT